MAKTVLNNISTFDPIYNKTVTFSDSGAVAYKNRLLIIDAVLDTTVYDQTITSMKYEHVIPANTLTAGKQYTAQAQTFDINNVASTISNKVYFIVLTTPTFTFSNVTENQYVTTSYLDAILSYSQPQGELLKEYKFMLYNSANVLLYSSDILYDTSLTYKYTYLDNNEIYYVKAIGETVNGFSIETSAIKINVSYSGRDTYYTFNLENDYYGGNIKFNTNIIIIQYNGTEVFSYDNGFIDLTSKQLFYDQGFNINDDFTIKIKYKDIKVGTVFEMDDGYNISLKLIEYEGTYIYMLEVDNTIGKYIIHSTPITAISTDIITLFIRRKNDVFQLEVYKEV